jgi:hypothetical protein
MAKPYETLAITKNIIQLIGRQSIGSGIKPVAVLGNRRQVAAKNQNKADPAKHAAN